MHVADFLLSNDFEMNKDPTGLSVLFRAIRRLNDREINIIKAVVGALFQNRPEWRPQIYKGIN